MKRDEEWFFNTAHYDWPRFVVQGADFGKQYFVLDTKTGARRGTFTAMTRAIRRAKLLTKRARIK